MFLHLHTIVGLLGILLHFHYIVGLLGAVIRIIGGSNSDY